MRLASRLEEARQASRHLLSALRLSDGYDEAAVYSFDMNLQSLQPFTADAGEPEAPSMTVPGPAGALGTQLRRLGSQSVIYGLGGLVQRILAVFLVPLYTHYLHPSDYGHVATLLFGLTPGDPATVTGAALVLTAIGAVAGWVPARLASRIDPARVLRDG